MSLFRSKGRPGDTMNFQVEISYFFGPTVKVDISAEMEV